MSHAPLQKIYFFVKGSDVYAVAYQGELSGDQREKLELLLNANCIPGQEIIGKYIGKNIETPSPFSDNLKMDAAAVGVNIARVEKFTEPELGQEPHIMLERVYNNLGQDLFPVAAAPKPLRHIADIAAFNTEMRIGMDDEKIQALEAIAEKYCRPLTDAEIFAYGNLHSEHCAHNYFNGKIIIDGVEQPETMFQMIKDTRAKNPHLEVSSYKDNTDGVEGPSLAVFAPDENGVYKYRTRKITVTSKAESHNRPSEEEPFNGAGTGAGGEFRDRYAFGRGGMTDASSFVAMATADVAMKYYSAEEMREGVFKGGAHWANVSGAPLINTAFFADNNFTKPLVQAGGVGHTYAEYALKDDGKIKKGQRVILMGGPAYRVGVGGATSSSLGAESLPIDDVQRMNPEMQMRIRSLIAALMEQKNNPIVSIHDNGAGGVINCIIEMVKSQGAHIDISKMPLGDTSLSPLEILSSESQERMCVLIDEENVEEFMKTAEREDCPVYDIGHITGDHRIVCEMADGSRPIDMHINDMTKSLPQKTIHDKTVARTAKAIEYDDTKFEENLHATLSNPVVGSKDWIVNSVINSDAAVIQNQNAGDFNLPLNRYGIVTNAPDAKEGTIKSVGFAPEVAYRDVRESVRTAVLRAVLNLIFCPLKDGLKSISLGANWYANVSKEGELAELYAGVDEARQVCNQLGIAITTGKDSLSMKTAPVTVVISAKSPQAMDFEKRVQPVMKTGINSPLFHIPVNNNNFANVFAAVQEAISKGLIAAGQTVAHGGMISSLLEMTFANQKGGISLYNKYDDEKHGTVSEKRFSEKPGLVLQVEIQNNEKFQEIISKYCSPSQPNASIKADMIGITIPERELQVKGQSLNIDELRESWMEPSYQMEARRNNLADLRRKNRFKQPVKTKERDFIMPNINLGAKKQPPVAAVLRTPGAFGARDLAYMARDFEVRDIHITDLAAGRKDFRDVDFLLFPDGVNARALLARFTYNLREHDALSEFYGRDNTLSLGIGSGANFMTTCGIISGKSNPLLPNKSEKYESGLVSATIYSTHTGKHPVIFQGMEQLRLPAHISTATGRFNKHSKSDAGCNACVFYSQIEYPGNPVGDKESEAAAVASLDGRHVAIIPNIERGAHPFWNAMFINAYNYLQR